MGFDITLAKYIAENLGVELVIEPMGFDASQTAVYTGSVPMSISGYSWTEDRAQNYELSDYYYAGENETRQALLIKRRTRISTPPPRIWPVRTWARRTPPCRCSW